MAALQFIEVPGYSALIFRRTFRDLDQPGALMDRAREWFNPTPAVWSEKKHAWRFPSGAIIQFGYLEHEKQKFRYQSAEFQFIGFDELTQFTATQYRYLFTRLRRPQVAEGDSDQVAMRKQALARVPLRMRGATNPGGEGHEWVKRRFIRGTHPNRTFHFATLYDNPHLDQKSYLASLAELDEVTRLQMQEGNWDATDSGGMMERGWFQMLQHAPPKVNSRVRYWDLAATDPKPGRDADYTAGALCSLDPSNRLIVEDMVRFRGTPGDVEQRVQSTAEQDGSGVPIYFEQEGGSSGKSLISHYRRNVLAGYTVMSHSKGKGKVAMASPWAAMAKYGDVYLVEGPWVEAFLDEAEAFPIVGHDDQVDAVSGAYSVMAARLGIGKVRKRTRPVPHR